MVNESFCCQCLITHPKDLNNEFHCPNEKVPKGFVYEEDIKKEFGDDYDLNEVCKSWNKIDAKLFTNRSGSNLIRIKLNNRFCYLLTVTN